MTTAAHPDRVLVVGAGLAGLRTVAELRAAGYTGQLELIGAEVHPPYDRPPLSKELLTRPDPVWLAEDLGHDLASLADEVHLGVRATALHPGPDGVSVSTAGGRTFSAGQVVIATGSHAIRPPAWTGVVTLHTLDEAEHLRSTLAAQPEVVVIGAGWIGAEVAGVAAGAGCSVQVLEAGPVPLWHQLGEELGARTVPWYAQAEVHLRTQAAVTAVEHGKVTLADGSSHSADLVLCAIGARPDTAWLAGAVPLTDRGHVPVDAAGRSPVPGVWAVGDVAERDHPLFGRVPGGHWSAALTDPAPLARAMLGQELPAVEPAPYLNSMQLGHQLTVYGRLTEDRITRGDPATGPWSTLCLAGDRLTGAVVADAPRDVAAVRKLLGRGELPVLDRAAATDPAVKLARAVA
ncbi:NAD(P)/FAD-dependent oxidoreductase [Ruania albidiflava]|uniref:NAD(P)/FAD-dependent oxidoreductase n=1 Tax=Ruania albidiflava TaxID=366586 RepID=UPI0023F4C616|nr:FAD-dependent oxidoreductase [Ruania albidiflava]